MKKKYRKKIKEGVYDIFKAEMLSEISDNYYKGTGLTTVLDEPLVKQQIIQLARLCEDVSSNVTLRSSGNKTFIEFW